MLCALIALPVVSVQSRVQTYSNKKKPKILYVLEEQGVLWREFMEATDWKQR